MTATQRRHRARRRLRRAVRHLIWLGYWLGAPALLPILVFRHLRG